MPPIVDKGFRENTPSDQEIVTAFFGTGKRNESDTAHRGATECTA